MIRIAVKIAYLGEHFSGSQAQPGFRTVEGDILSDLKIITKLQEEEIDLRLASRTDRGVNSLGNVAVFCSSIDDPDIMIKALNAVSKDIYYRGAAVVKNDFNPRFAELRMYRYALSPAGLDVSVMQECAELFAGEHDFTRFCKPEGKSPVIVLNPIEVYEKEGIVLLDFSARYFLWNMIRRIAAAIVSVGKGESSVSDVKEALDGNDTTFGIARPEALTLLDVCYGDIIFKAPPADSFGKRAEEEMFRNSLRNIFFTSL